ncbi:hypothetical protein D3C85_548830 [compost metagenome]
MTFVLAQWIAAALVLISLIHVYWALGGQWASDAVVPLVQGDQGPRPAFKPSALVTLVVAAGLLLIALMVSLRVGLIVPAIDHWSLQWLISAIALMMFARAIGDSESMGFFKEHAESKFARLDTWAYSPLCVVLGAGLLAVAWA